MYVRDVPNGACTMRRREGFKEISIYLTDEQYAELERYWRFKTTHKFVTHAASELLLRSLDQEKAADSAGSDERTGAR